MFVTIFKLFLLPPAFQLMLLALAAVTWRIWRRLSIALILISTISLWYLSTPMGSSNLYRWLEAPFILPEQALTDLDAIVVLGGGRMPSQPEYGGQDQVSESALWRLRYAASLARQYELPILVSGGTVYQHETEPEAVMSARVLNFEYGISEVWLEGASRDTWQNAQFSTQIIREKSLQTVGLVTHAYHMRRAVMSFGAFKQVVTPLATGFRANDISQTYLDWIPQSYYLHRSRVALHEYLGLAFYALRQ